MRNTHMECRLRVCWVVYGYFSRLGSPAYLHYRVIISAFARPLLLSGKALAANQAAWEL